MSQLLLFTLQSLGTGAAVSAAAAGVSTSCNIFISLVYVDLAAFAAAAAACAAAAAGERGDAVAHLSLLLCFPFTSNLQRTTSVAEFTVATDVWRGPHNQQQQQQGEQQQEEQQELRQLLQRKQKGFIVAVKGAPERIKQFLANVPPSYDSMADELTGRVRRAAAAAAAAAVG